MAKMNRAAARRRRQGRVRKQIHGTAERPRMAVFRSNRHIGVQLIDDDAGHTLASASTYEPSVASGTTSNVDAAKAIGTEVANRAKSAGIDSVVFDRGGNLYHGRVAAVADAAREAGLEF